MSIMEIENQLEQKFSSYSYEGILSLGDEYYFPYFMFHFRTHLNPLERTSILNWLYEDKISNSIFITNALSKFVQVLNEDSFLDIIKKLIPENHIFGKRKRIIELFFVPPTPLLSKIESRSKLFNNFDPKFVFRKRPNIQIEFLEWFDSKLLNEFKGEKKSEIAYHDEVHTWVKQKFQNLLNKEKVSTQDDTPLIKRGKRGWKRKRKNENLFDIWKLNKDNTKDEYDLYIDCLKQFDSIRDKAFIEEINGVLYWKRLQVRGDLQYLLGFVHICLEHNWIQNNYFSTDYLDIIENTFNIRPGKDLFKKVIHGPKSNKYKQPFIHLPKNI